MAYEGKTAIGTKTRERKDDEKKGGLRPLSTPGQATQNVKKDELKCQTAQALKIWTATTGKSTARFAGRMDRFAGAASDPRVEGHSPHRTRGGASRESNTANVSCWFGRPSEE